MPIRSTATTIAAVILLVACAGEASEGARSGGNGALPAAVHGGLVAHGGHRPHSVGSCTGSGTGSFVGGGFENVAGAAYSGVLEGNSNEVCDEESSVGGGYYNYIASGANTSYYAFIGSGYDNSISGSGYQSVIGGGNVNSLTGPNSVIGGGNQNNVSNSDAVVAGGSANTMSGSYGFIGGGNTNAVGSEGGVVAGGDRNNAGGIDAAISGGVSNVVQDAYGAIGGGDGNNVSAMYGTIGGGYQNAIPGEYGVVGGGYRNSAGPDSTVPGGVRNVANGLGAFAAGVGSTAAYNGAFVWSDYASGATSLAATGPNQFLIRSVGGVTFYTSANLASGVRLMPGAGSWSNLSDRNAKRDVLPVDADSILSRVAALPISEWSYDTEGNVRHVGPMAQDFYSVFKVGEDDRHITSIDEDGIALAAIKALNAKLIRRDAEIADLQAQLKALAARVDALSAARK